MFDIANVSASHEISQSKKPFFLYVNVIWFLTRLLNQKKRALFSQPFLENIYFPFAFLYATNLQPFNERRVIYLTFFKHF